MTAGRAGRELDEQIAFRLDMDLLDLVDQDAAANGRTRSQTIRHHLQRGLTPGDDTDA